MMLLKLSWRNIWRNKRRSIVVLISIIVGVIAIIFMDALTTGMLKQMLNNQIRANISHIQIHKKGFNDNKVVQNFVPDPGKVEQALNSNPNIEAYSKRVITFGLLSSASNSSGVFLTGVDQEREKEVSFIYSMVDEGNYLTGKSGEIVIGERLAEKLKVGLGDKVVALANTPEGNIGSDVFRITGIYKSPSSEFDKAFIYVNINDAQNMLDVNNNIYEYAIITDNFQNVATVRDELRTSLSDQHEVLSYQDLLPLMIMQVDMYRESMYVVNLIVGLALIFGIINSMLMSVFERINEFGVLMSIGMKNRKIFAMILMEAFTLGVIGTIIGLIGGYLFNMPLEHSGIDLSIFSESMESFGIGAILYPTVSFENIIATLIMIPFISVIGALYPAFKAIRLEPVYAIRYI